MSGSKRAQRHRGEGNGTEPGERRSETDVVVGNHSVTEVLKTAPDRVQTVFVREGSRGDGVQEIRQRCREGGVRVERLDDHSFRQRFPGDRAHGVAARLRARVPVPLSDLLNRRLADGAPPWLVLLDGVEDPRNLGAIIRSAEAFGADGLVLPSRRSAPLGTVAAKTSAGGVHHLPYTVATNLKYTVDELKEGGMKIVGLEAGGDRAPWEEDLSGPLGVVLGSEGGGMRGVVRRRCDRILSIPMPGRLDSLNVSVAAGILFYEILAQRLRKK